MGAHMDRPQVMTLDVVDTGRRRRWTDAEKQRIIEESFAAPRQVAATARRHGMSRSLLTTWRRLHRQDLLPRAGTSAPGFASVTLAPNPPPTPAPRSPVVDCGRVEIVLRNNRRIIIGAGMDLAALAQLIAVVKRA